MRVDGVKYRWRELFRVVWGVLVVIKDPAAAERVADEVRLVIEGARRRHTGLSKG
ncbi:hypothetical protein [Streptomyces sp. NPDC086182]|uniref:hypothetical protein n=1 Tax=Streptomyces sp. NPDC086182 TaxID=3155058 RepID=UPI003446BEEB